MCIKQVDVLGRPDKFERNDEDNQVYAGACAGLDSIAWNGAGVQGILVTNAAVAGVNSLTLRQYGANGRVQLDWVGR